MDALTFATLAQHQPRRALQRTDDKPRDRCCAGCWSVSVAVLRQSVAAFKTNTDPADTIIGMLHVTEPRMKWSVAKCAACDEPMEYT